MPSPLVVLASCDRRRLAGRDPTGACATLQWGALTLVTGPANAEKARVVLDGFRAAADRAPLLVVPTFDDVARYRRELAEDGLVFGTAILRFGHLASELARRAGVRGRGLTRLQRERVAAAAVAAAPLDILRRVRRDAGLPRRARAPGERARAAARRSAALHERAAGLGGRHVARGLRGGARGAVRGLPRRAGEDGPAGRRPASRRGARRPAGGPGALGRPPGVPLRLRRPAPPAARGRCRARRHRRGRVPVARRSRPGATRSPAARRRSRPCARSPTASSSCPPRPDHYASPALHHLERRLFEPPEDGTLFDAGAPDPGDAITLLEGGGERAELELVAAEVARMIREDGIAPEEIAIVARDVPAVAPQLRRVFAAAGVPVALERHAIFGHTPLGARPRGAAALRAAGRQRRGPPDVAAHARAAARARARRQARGARTAGGRAHRRGGARALGARAAGRWTRSIASPPRTRAGRRRSWRRFRPSSRPASPRPSRAARPSSTARRPPTRACSPPAGARSATSPTWRARRRGSRPRRTSSPGCSPSSTSALRDAAAAGAVAVSDPLSLRARRVRALVLCGLQENRFPRPAKPEPFLGDAERRELAVASGLVLRRHEDTLDAERFLLYATVSRPEERLVLSWHDAGDDGEPAVRSLFVDDIAGAVRAGPASAGAEAAASGRSAGTRARRRRSPSVAERPRPPGRAGARRRRCRCATPRCSPAYGRAAPGRRATSRRGPGAR